MKKFMQSKYFLRNNEGGSTATSKELWYNYFKRGGMAMKRNYTWINDDIKIDFPLPKVLQNLVDELEKLDMEEDWLYLDRCEFLENITKECIISGWITDEQRDLLCHRYTC